MRSGLSQPQLSAPYPQRNRGRILSSRADVSAPLTTGVAGASRPAGVMAAVQRGCAVPAHGPGTAAL